MAERRRGNDLERALLEAAWLELTNNGYSGLTMEDVAERAGTSRPVIARRWTGKAELAVAAIRQEMAKYPLDVPDRGDVRTELMEFLDRASLRAVGLAAAFALLTSEFFSDVGSGPKSLHEALTRGELEVEKHILRRAVTRQEVRPSALEAPVSTLLGDLFRHHAIMNFAPPPADLRRAWVDAIFLPLVRTEPIR